MLRQIHIELLEILELYSETLLARFALLDLPGREPDPQISEPIAALIHSAPRVELRELHILREMLLSRYSREFGQDAIENNKGVAGARVTSRLKVSTPSPELVDLYISEICKAYDVKFESPHLKAGETDKEEQDAVEEATSSATAAAAAANGETASATSANGGLPPPAAEPTLDPKAGPATRSDALTSKAVGNTVPKEAADSSMANKTLGTKKEVSSGASKEQKDYDDLEARFAALKKR